MSHVDSTDEEVKSLLAEINSNDSKESDKIKIDDKKTLTKKDIITKKDGFDEYYEDKRTFIPDGEDDTW